MVGITSFGAYIPLLRLSRKSIADTDAWLDPGLASRGKGERAMANWDEDPVTMAVEAARDCTSTSSKPVDALLLATTSAPFLDRQHAGIVNSALQLGEDTAVLDVTSSQRAGTSALLQALAAAQGDMYQNILVIAADKRQAQAVSPQIFNIGDGAAAVSVGQEDVLLNYLGGASVTVDFVDHYKAKNHEFDFTWEERWIRDEGYLKIVPAAIESALKKTALEASAIDHFIMPGTIGRVQSMVAKKAGIAAETIADNLHANCGETGTAHPLVMLLNTIEGEVSAGQKVMLVGFGQGADVLIFEITDKLAKRTPTRGVRGSLARRRAETNYQKLLAFNDLIKVNKGMRADIDNPTALSVAYRHRDMLLGLVGGRCPSCDTPQFPAEGVCVHCHRTGELEPYSFREEPAHVLTWSADYLTYIPNPPSHYGMIEFKNGGRFITDISDVLPGEVEVGMPVRMVFRVKSIDPKRGFVNYFWKAVPE